MKQNSLKKNHQPLTAALHNGICFDNAQHAAFFIQYRYPLNIYKSKNSFYEKEYIHRLHRYFSRSFKQKEKAQRKA